MWPFGVIYIETYGLGGKDLRERHEQLVRFQYKHHADNDH